MKYGGGGGSASSFSASYGQTMTSSLENGVSECKKAKIDSSSADALEEKVNSFLFIIITVDSA